MGDTTEKPAAPVFAPLDDVDFDDSGWVYRLDRDQQELNREAQQRAAALLPEPPHPELKWQVRPERFVHRDDIPRQHRPYRPLVGAPSGFTAVLVATQTEMDPSACNCCGNLSWYPFGIGCVDERCAASPHRYRRVALTDDGWENPDPAAPTATGDDDA